MSAESEGSDPYVIVLADLKAKRDQIDQAIQALESLRSGPKNSASVAEKAAGAGTPEAGEFLGMSIAEAAKKLLARRKQAMGNADIASGLTGGGLVMSENTDHQNIVGSVLTRRFEKVGDIVRVSRGMWGLKEWYPNRSFKAKGAEEGPKNGTSEPAQPSAPKPDAQQE